MIACQSVRRRIKTEETANVVAAIWSLLDIFHKDDFEEKVDWRNECFEQMDNLSVHPIPNHHPTKKDVLAKTFVQIILDSK